MNIILCGYNWIGCNVLSQLIGKNNRIFVFTHESPYYVPSVSDFCKRKNISFSFENISSSELPFKPDVICSIYYRYIIKKHIITSCSNKIFNLHPSLLPHYKGCSSLTWALINGEKHVGFTYHYIDEGCDTGDIIYQKKMKVYEFDTQLTLYQRVMYEASKKFNTVLKRVLCNVPGKKQIGEGSYYKRGCPYEGQIDDNWNDDKTERFIRAMYNPPYPMAKYKNQEIKTIEDFYTVKKG